MKSPAIPSVAAAALVIALAAISSAAAAATPPELRHRAPDPVAKSDHHVGAHRAADGREGGEDIATAMMIPALPFNDTGATCDNLNDYAWMCPYGNWAPDVVYRFEVPHDMLLNIDLCGSLYDTLILVFTPDVEYIACNDDFYFDDECGHYVSKIENLPLAGDQTIYIAVDGYTSDCGVYFLEVTETIGLPCDVPCPGGAVIEGEPPLVDDYEDAHNGGCNSPQFGNPFQALWGTGGSTLSFCGVSGWYEFQFEHYRDTDWFTVILDSGGDGALTVTLDAEIDSYLFELGPQDCDAVAVLQTLQTEPCIPGTMTVTGTPGDLVWLWVGPTTFESPVWYDDDEYDYVLTIDGLEDGVIAVERGTWSGVKELYR